MPTLAVTSGASAADRRTERGAHSWFFRAEESDLLRTAQPSLGWQRVGTGQWTLPWGDFMPLALAGAMASPAMQGQGAFSTIVPDPDLIDRSWTEVQKGMGPDDWEPCEMGEFKRRLRDAAASTFVDSTQLRVFADAAGLAMDTDGQATTTASATGDGSPFALPGWVEHVLWEVGSLLTDGDFLVAATFEYYGETRVAKAFTTTGSPFASFLEEALEAAILAGIAAGSTRAAIEGKRPRVLAQIVLRHIRATAWPEILDIYAAEGVARELDLGDRYAFATCGGEGVAAQAITVARLERVVKARSLAPLGALLKGHHSLDALVQAVVRLQSAAAVRAPDLVVPRSLGDLCRALKSYADVIAADALSRMNFAERVDDIEKRIRGGGARAAGDTFAVEPYLGSRDGGDRDARLSSRLHQGRLTALKLSPPYMETVDEARRYTAGEQPAFAIRILLAGRPARDPSVAGGVHVPGVAAHEPIALMHMLLVGKRAPDIYAVDANLDFVKGLRDAVPRILGAMVAKAMGMTNHLSLPDLCAATRPPLRAGVLRPPSRVGVHAGRVPRQRHPAACLQPLTR